MSDGTISYCVRLVTVVAAFLVLAASLATRLAENSTAAVSSTMFGTVGPGYEISLTYADGSAVTEAPSGTYTVSVADRSEEHNFHLLGPGVEEATAVSGEGSVTWRVTFRNNERYYFQCDPHSDAMYGRFDVGNVSSSTSSSGGGSGSGGGGSSPSASPVVPSGAGATRGALAATIDVAARLTVKLNGKPVTKLKQGRYKIVVSDKSSKNNVAIRRIDGKGTALTGVGFIGKRTVTVNLTSGRWKLYSGVREAATSAFFVVTKG